jgi:gluconokinase
MTAEASDPPRVLLLMGVSGCGKSTAAAGLSARLGWPYRDADSFHPPANVEKMSRGTPLADEDRWPWLQAIAAWIEERLARGEPGIVTCSALKRTYRDVLLAGGEGVRLVFLRGDKPLIAARLAERRDHFMPPALLDSQFAALQEPSPDERPLVVSIAAAPAAVVDEIVARLGLSEAASAEADAQR